MRCRIRPISKSSLRLLSWFLCLCLLSACSVGPKYKTPAAPMPPAFKEPPPANFKENGEWKQAAPQDDRIRGDWWEIFGDPQLNDLEAQVNVSNQTIAVAEAQFRAARTAVRAARSGLFPTLTVAGSAITTGSGAAGNRAVLGAGNVVRAGGGTSYTLPFDLTYEADVWGKVRKAIEAAAATAQATAADLETIRLSVHAELALDYFELRGLDEEQALFEQTVAGSNRRSSSRWPASTKASCPPWTSSKPVHNWRQHARKR